MAQTVTFDPAMNGKGADKTVVKALVLLLSPRKAQTAVDRASCHKETGHAYHTRSTKETQQPPSHDYSSLTVLPTKVTGSNGPMSSDILTPLA